MSLFLALALGSTAVAPVQSSLEHRTQLEHSGAVVDVHYQTRIALDSRQIGSVTKAGTPSTLRCLWRADVAVERQARHGALVRLSRGIDSEGVIEGSRPGWCAANRQSIEKEVAKRADEIRTHVEALAREDEKVLRAELAQTAVSREG